MVEPRASDEQAHGSGRPTSVGIIGGTGALGRGLALRWSMAGIDVRLGSRDEARAGSTAASLGERLQDRPGVGAISGATNAEVVASEAILVLSVPLAGLDATLDPLRESLAGRILICAVNPLGFDAQGPHLAPGPAPSVAESVAAAVPLTRVVAAFHTVSSRELAAVTRPMDDDVPITGDDPDACAVVAALAGVIEGCRGVVAGPLRLASSVEALTPLLISVNRRASAHVGVRLSRLPTAPAG